ncbi:hypothetical protein [Butyrivibrio sp. AE3006]|uniref:hypothetical protein n=1 Tax=Butyrivibrio sp. AE3006 TaxID=1280673 RepID=UPI0003FB7669|nr:hypothetical protein [Butyrivibrio sp. AE3006]
MEDQRKADPYTELANKVLGRIAGLGRSEKIKLKRTAGLRADELKPDDRILFYGLFPENIPADKYLVDCILFGVQIACEQDDLGTDGCLVQDLLAAEYDKGKSKSSMRRIEAFMASDSRDNEVFFRDLDWLLEIVLKKKKANVFTLTRDLIKWEYGGRDRWLDAIIKIKHNKIINNDTDSQEEK